MARAARLSGHEDEDPDYEEIEAVLHSQRKDPLTRAKKAVHRLVQRVGFFGILLCASVSPDIYVCHQLPQTYLIYIFALLDSQPSVRPCWNNMWSFLNTILDIFWCYTHWKSHHKNAHSSEFDAYNTKGMLVLVYC